MTAPFVRSFCRFSLFLLFILLFGFNSHTLTAQDCGECSNPRVALYDFAVNVPRPAQADSIKKWLGLFFVGPRARGYVHNDSQNGCITFLDGATINAADFQGDTLRYGPEFTNLPPSGSLKCADYLLSGEVEGSNGVYSAKISFESAWSREVVATGYVTFSTSNGPNAIDNAGLSLARQISPLISTIRSFELKKRNTDIKVAIRDKWSKGTASEIEIKPSKKDVDVNETIDVEIKMTDCDGVPLANREILFAGNDPEGNPLETSKGGRFSGNSAVTDENGVAKTQFIAGSEKGTGFLYAYYVHEKPTGKPALFLGTAIINIKQPPAEYWKLNASFMETKTLHSDTTMTYLYEEVVNNTKIFSSCSGHVSAILRNMSDKPGDFSFYVEVEDPMALCVNGSFSETEMSKHFEYVLGKLHTADVRTDNKGGAADGAGISVDLSDTLDFFSLMVNVPIDAQYNGNHYGSPPSGGDVTWYPYGGKYTGGEFSILEVNSAPGVYISRSGNGYSVNWSKTENTVTPDYYGRIYLTVEKSLSATLTPYDNSTGVEEQLRPGLPSEYLLEQNYPNPFNPSTKIRYSIPERTFVTLKVFDVLGSEIASLVNGEKTAGNYEAEFNASNLASGIYIYKIQAGKFSSARKLLLVK